MKLFLHIGTEKTGTTTIQTFLSDNRAELAARDLCVPVSLGRGNHRWLPVLCYRPDYIDDHIRRHGMEDPDVRAHLLDEKRARFEAEMAAVEAPAVVISSEHLQSRLRTAEEIAALRDLLARWFSEIEIVVYLRDPFAMAVSLLSTALKAGGTGADVPPPDDPYVQQIADYRRLLTMWGEVFGTAALTPRLFERDVLWGGDLLADFCAVLGVDPAGLAVPGNQNASLGGRALAILQSANVAIRRNAIADGDRLRHRLVSTLERNLGGGQAFRGSAARRDQYAAFYAESNEWARSTWFPDRARLFSEAPVRPAGAPAFDTSGLEPALVDRLAAALLEMAAVGTGG